MPSDTVGTKTKKYVAPTLTVTKKDGAVWVNGQLYQPRQNVWPYYGSTREVFIHHDPTLGWVLWVRYPDSHSVVIPMRSDGDYIIGESGVSTPLQQEENLLSAALRIEVLQNLTVFKILDHPDLELKPSLYSNVTFGGQHIWIRHVDHKLLLIWGDSYAPIHELEITEDGIYVLEGNQITRETREAAQ